MGRDRGGDPRRDLHPPELRRDEGQVLLLDDDDPADLRAPARVRARSRRRAGPPPVPPARLTVGEAADVVHRATDRLNERDVDGFVELCSKRIRFQDVPEIPGSRLYQGPDEVRGWAEGILELSDDVRFGLWDKEERDDAVM